MRVYRKRETRMLDGRELRIQCPTDAQDGYAELRMASGPVIHRRVLLTEQDYHTQCARAQAQGWRLAEIRTPEESSPHQVIDRQIDWTKG
jgi:hypothetical protein